MANALRYHSEVDLSQQNNTHSQLVLLTGRDKSVLEIGSATGYITEALQQRGCHVTAIEIDPAAAEIAARFCERMIVGDVETIDFAETLGDQRFDVVMFGDVLEHLVDPASILERIKPHIAPDGCVVASVPNIAHGSIRLALMQGDFRYTESGLLDKTHLRFFTRATLDSLFSDAGYLISTWRSITSDPLETEQGLVAADFPRYLLSSIRDDPEALTYQFVVKASPAISRSADAPKQDSASCGRADGLMTGLWRVEEAAGQRDSALAQQATRIAETEAVLAERNALLSQQESTIADLREQLTSIRDSTGYRILEALRRRVRWIFPPGSWRRAPYQALSNLVRFALPQRGAFVVSRRRRLLRLPRRSLEIIRREGWRSFLSKAWNRLTARQRYGGPHPQQEIAREFTPLTFPRCDQPLVSIVIPVYNKALYTFNCLLSVLLNSDGVSYEVIVVDDGSTDETQSMLAEIENIRVEVNQKNVGFGHTCNNGARLATGRYIAFLNNDTQVHKGWLSALVEVAESDSSAGLVGAKLVYPDGTLQEAGGIVWRDGSAWNYGRRDDPEKPEYNYVRDVDYCSAACVLVPRNLFEKAGGFSSLYEPAYYEDTDLAFTIREMGYRVIYQPKAVVTHFEGVTAGTDTLSGTKRYQEVNRSKFVDKWRTALERNHLANAQHPLLARDRRQGPRALVIDHQIPAYDRDAGSLRMFELLKILTRLGFVITFVPDNMARREPYTQELQRMGIEVLYGPKDIAEHIRGLGPHLRLCLLSRPDVASVYLPLVRKSAPEAVVFYDTVDLHFVREERRATIEMSDSARKSAEHYRRLELALANSCDATIVVTEAEKSTLLSLSPGLTVHVIPTIHEGQPCRTRFSERHGLLFVGSFLHPPNSDAAVHFVNNIFPLIKKDSEDLTLTIVGADPGPEVKALASTDVVVTGWVKDIAPYIERARVFVAPLQYGAGLKGKIGQAMSFGLPTVTTRVGAEGIAVSDDIGLMIADEPVEFAAKVLRLYHDEALWQTLSDQAMSHVQANYSPDVISRRVLDVVLQHGLAPGGGETVAQPTAPLVSVLSAADRE